MVQHFSGQLSGLSIEQKQESEESSKCIRDCKEYLDLSDVQRQSDIVCRLKFYF